MTFATLFTLVVGTFVSEDLACVAAGLLIARGDVNPASAIAACAIGIFLGDCGLWVLGRCGGVATNRLGWLRSWMRIDTTKESGARAWLERRGSVAILASRLVPGTRLPLYVAAGVVGFPLRLFAFWTLIAAVIWTPAIVLASAQTGGVLVGRTSASWSIAVVVVGLVLALRGARHMPQRGMNLLRLRLAARLARLRRWEFWPAWLFYAPVALWIAWLALRYHGVTTMTAANPGIADGGTVGESKYEILRKLPAEFTIPALLVPPGDIGARLVHAGAGIQARDWKFPIVAKPDVGERGAGVKLLHGRGELREYLLRLSDPILLQPYHSGPFEAGVFYYRIPGQSRGQILSMTDKRFPVVVGDGESTMRELIYRHERYRVQADVFLGRHAHVADRVLGIGERFQLAMAGNHAQGTTFLDGGHLLTPALERRIDAIAKRVEGFFIGRFDIRYHDVDAFKAGFDLAIVELNGVTAEPTSVYDPGTSLVSAYRQLFRQWSLVFRIGAENRRHGASPTSMRRLMQLAAVHLRAKPVFAHSD